MKTVDKKDSKRVVQVGERPPLKEMIPLSLQHMFAMFGASVVVPILLGVNPSIVLFMNGIGTLLFLFITQGKSPAFLGSSFAFIAPAMLIIQRPELGYRYALGGFIISGLIFCLFAFVVKIFKTKWIDVLLPAAAMGPVVALIGLELAEVAAHSAGLLSEEIDLKDVIVFIITLGTAVIGALTFRKFFGVIPILISIVVGYVSAMALGMIDYDTVGQANWVALPEFQLPLFDLSSILIIMPATLVVLSEHIGHQLVTGKVIDRDLIKEPGLHRSLLGDGLSTVVSGFCGSVPTTTYGENIGVMAITRVYSVWVLGGAAAISICVAFIGKISAMIQTIPGPVMGGVSFLLYGMIATSGLRLVVDAKVDYGKSRNLVLSSVVLLTGLSGVNVTLGEVQLRGMALATIVGMFLSLLLYALDKLKLTNDNE